MASSAVRRQHAMFIAKRLAIAFIGLGTAPLFLAFRGAPNVIETLVFACSFAPLAAVLVVARTGRLVAAHAVACVGLASLGLILYGLGCGASVSAAWLLAALFEASLSADKRLATGAALLCAIGLAVVALAKILALEPSTASPVMATVFSGLALAYAVIVSIGAGSVVAASTSEQDETEIRAAAAELLDDLVVSLDATASVTHVSASRTDQLGFVATDLMGRGLFEHIHITDRPGFLKLIADVAYGGRPAVETFRLRLPRSTDEERLRPPQYAWVELRATRLALRDQKEGPAPVVALLRDAEASRAQTIEIAAAQTTMEEAAQSKAHFLANMSHELRTPLNAIIGFSEMLGSHTLRPSDAERQREYARIINQSGLHLLSVVNSILDMSKIRSGTFSIVPAAFDVVPLLDLSCDMVALTAEEGRITLVRDYPETLEEIVGDKRACKQILINLLSNAVKFTPEHGQVTLSARPEGNSLVISVKDTGIGIGAADLARLGDPFFQARSSLSRPFEGTGLGLSVVRGLVGLHGGTIALESELGRGTCVKVCLPLDCRVLGEAKSSATIETLARRQTVDPQISCIDRRMKQIA